jgi:hypothetical protein
VAAVCELATEPAKASIAPEATPVKECPFCGEPVRTAAKKCKHCGETIDVALRAAEEARRLAEKAEQRASERQPAAPMVFMNAGGGGGGSSSSSSSSSSAAAAVVSVRPSRRRYARPFPHLMHAVLTFFTCGAWLPIWVLHYCLYLIASGQNALLVATVGVPLAVALLIGGLVIVGGIASVSNQSKTTQGAKPTSAIDDPATTTEPPAQQPMGGEGEVIPKEAMPASPAKPSSEPTKDQQKQPTPVVESARDRMKRLAEEEKRKLEAERAAERQRAEADKAEMKAASYLKYAKKLIREGQTEKAKERLMEIIRDFPTTEAAKESKTLLESL